MGIASLILGVLAGVGGFLLYDFVTCVGPIGELCIGSSRPYENRRAGGDGLWRDSGGPRDRLIRPSGTRGFRSAAFRS